jgi:hypothetical protein
MQVNVVTKIRSSPFVATTSLRRSFTVGPLVLLGDIP